MEQAKQATAARDAAEQALYYNRVALADQHLAAHQADLAEQLLDDCPPSLRRWEWHYLKRLCYADSGPNLPRAAGPISGLAFSPDGRRLAAAVEDGAVIVLDGTTGLWLFWRFGHSGPVRSVAFSPDGRVLASGGGNPDVARFRHSSPVRRDDPLGRNVRPRAVAIGPRRPGDLRGV